MCGQFATIYGISNMLKMNGLLAILWTSLFGIAIYLFVLFFTGGVSHREKAIITEIVNKIVIIKGP